MGKKRVNMVTLATDKGSREFEINHAERLLRMKNNGGWKLPEDSQYKFHFNNGITHNRNTRKVKGEKEAGNDRSGSQA